MSDVAKPKRRWMSVLLVISLALNLLVVGAALGTILRVKGGDHAKAPPGFGPALYRALPKEDRKLLRGQLSGKHTKGGKFRKAEFDALEAALRTVPFDPAPVRSILARQVDATAELQSALQLQWLQLVTEMTDDQRAAYADRLDDVVKRGEKHKARK